MSRVSSIPASILCAMIWGGRGWHVILRAEYYTLPVVWITVSSFVSLLPEPDPSGPKLRGCHTSRRAIFRGGHSLRGGRANGPPACPGLIHFIARRAVGERIRFESAPAHEPTRVFPGATPQPALPATRELSV